MRPPASANSRRQYNVGMAWRVASAISCCAWVANNAWFAITRPPAFISISFTKAASISRAVPACKISTRCPIERARRTHEIRFGVRPAGVIGIHENDDDGGIRQNLTQKSQPLGRRLVMPGGHAREITPRAIEALNQPFSDRIAARGEDDRNRGGRRLGCQRRLSAARRDDDRHLAAN